MTRYRWVDSRKAEGFPVTAACAVAAVSTSMFYQWTAKATAGPTDAELDEAYLVNAMFDIHADCDGVYGSPRMTAALIRSGWAVNHKRVERLMRHYGLFGVFKAARVRTTIAAEDAAPLPDLIGWRFAPGEPDVAYVGDITYIGTDEGWLYLASVLDLGSRRLLGYSMAEHMRAELVADALSMAAGARGGNVAGVIFHGDRGSQYLSAEYRELIAALEMRQSVGRTGVCWDNAAAESFWSSLKREVIHRYRFATRADARRAIFRWINWYNTQRLHSTLGYMPPIEWEHHYRHNTTPAKRAA